MIQYRVAYNQRTKRHKIRKIKVLGCTATGFRTAGPVALWPSAKNTFARLRDAKTYLATKTPLG